MRNFKVDFRLSGFNCADLCVYTGKRFFKAADGFLLSEQFCHFGSSARSGLCAGDCDTENPQGILAVCKKLDWDADAVLAKKTPFLLLAEELNDPGNLGTVIRTADACGADAVFLSKGSVDLYNPKVLRATMGSLFHVPVFQNIDLHALSEKMQAKQIPLYAAHLKGDRYPYALPLQDACAFLIGNEARGLSEDAAALCDAWVKIPMPGQAESLNASVAAGVLLYEVVRQRLPK